MEFNPDKIENNNVDNIDYDEKIDALLNESEEETQPMYKVVGVRFKDFGKVYYFDPSGLTLEPGDGVIVETVRGMEYAIVTSRVVELEESKLMLPLKSVVRIATDEDLASMERNKVKEKPALELCKERVEAHGLPMELVGCDYGFDGNRITFYFMADGRVDFRELVKDLAAQFHARIELRQIGPRDKAKLVGGIGPCGRAICCASFMSSFQPVSIKMAKDQNIALSPTKISGVCGRLMCCLKYEQSSYEEMRKRMPPIGSEVRTEDGNGIVTENNVLTEKVRVKIQLPDGTPELREYPMSEIKVIKAGKRNATAEKSYTEPFDVSPEDIKKLED